MECAHAREQLSKVERLDQVVVGTGIQTAHAVSRGVTCSQHQYRGRLVVPAQPGNHLDTIAAGHAPVDHGDVVFMPAQLVDRVVTTAGRVNLVASLLQAEHDNVAQTAIVFRYQHPHALCPR